MAVNELKRIQNYTTMLYTLSKNKKTGITLILRKKGINFGITNCDLPQQNSVYLDINTN